jgi:thiol:disulfide interchange protein DsbC
MKTLLRNTLLMLVLAAGLPAAANPDDVKAQLAKKFPEARVETVRKLPYGGLYEAVGAGEVFYTDEKTTYLLLGSLIDTKTRENVTEARMRKLTALTLDQLPLDSAIKIVRGNGSRKLAIFEDPNCGYCKQFERDLAGITDVTVYVMLYPILSPDSMVKSKAIWCSTDKGKAWMDYMLRQQAPASDGACETPIDKTLAFGHEKRITGTPTIFFEDGERVPGAIPAAQLEQKLAAAAASVSAKKK